MADDKQYPNHQNDEEDEEEPLQALRLKALAEQNYTLGNLNSAIKYAKRALNLRPNLAGVSEMLTAFNILSTARQVEQNPVDYYKILELERFSHINTVKKQYKKLALILHPDKNSFAASEEAFKLVGEAFRVLSDKIRRKEYDMKLRISMQKEAEAVVVVAEEDEEVDMFWTECSGCKWLHKFDKKYLGHNLVCPSCKKSFVADEVSENVEEEEDEEEDDMVLGQMRERILEDLGKGVSEGKRKSDEVEKVFEESKGEKVESVNKEREDRVVSQVRGSARIRERESRKLRDLGIGVSEKKNIDSVGEVLEKSKGRKMKDMGENYEGAGRDVESAGVVEGSGYEVMEEEEMMTIAEMQAKVKRKLIVEKMKVKGKEKEGEEVTETEERAKEKGKILRDEWEKEMALDNTEEMRDIQGVSKKKILVVYKRRGSKNSAIEKEKEVEEVREREKEKEKEQEGRQKEKENGTQEREKEKEQEGGQKEKENGTQEREKEKESSTVMVREKRERRRTWKLESFYVTKRREEKEKEKEKDLEEESENEMEMVMAKVKDNAKKRKISEIESLKVTKRRDEKDKKKEMVEKETETSMVRVKERKDRRRASKSESLEAVNRKASNSNMTRKSNLEIVAVEDSDFYDFDKDRVGRKFKKGQVWALYDDDDGMPRHYALVDEVVSVNPFEVRLDWLEFQSNGDEALISWEKLGFRISCGRFKVSTSITVKSLKIFSHIADCERAARELYMIYPKKGSVWAIHDDNALDGEQTNQTDKTCYDIVVFLTSYSQIHGLSMAYLEKVDGFKTVFQRREIGAHAISWLEKEDYRLFSHQIPARKLSGEEASGLSKHCWELDPASIPPELLTIELDR